MAVFAVTWNPQTEQWELDQEADMASLNDVHDRLVAQAKHGPRWNPKMREGECATCGDETLTVSWLGRRFCLNCLPPLPTALMHAPETEPSGIDPEYHAQVWHREV